MGYFGPMGEPISLMEWGELFERRTEDMSNESWWRRLTEIDDIVVSTVWMGIDHNFSGEGPPLVWETMVSDEAGDHDQRHTTRGQAMDAHEEIVRSLRARTPWLKHEHENTVDGISMYGLDEDGLAEQMRPSNEGEG